MARPLAGTVDLTQAGVEVGCLTVSGPLAGAGAGARSMTGARAGHWAAGEGMGQGTAVPLTTEIHPGSVKDIFQLLPEGTQSNKTG